MNKFKALICCHQVSMLYKQTNQIQSVVLKSINVRFGFGERIAIMGRSGSGKSTFLQVLAGFKLPSQGDIFFKNQSLSNLSENEKCHFRNSELGFIYQFHHLLPELNALENVMMPGLIQGLRMNDIQKKAQACLEAVGLNHHLKRLPAELSGGERQRVAIARAIVHQPALVLADEPSGNLDSDNAHQIIDLITHLNTNHPFTFIMATHDMSIAKKMDKILVLKDGCLQSD